METWILIIALTYANRLAMTNVPGYPTKAECEKAVASVTPAKRFDNAVAWCVPGPSKG